MTRLRQGVFQQGASMSWLDVSQRVREPELMDEPDLGWQQHAAALRGLQRINRCSGSAHILWGPIAELARTVARRPLRLLDVACGGGDVCLRLSRIAARAGVPLEVEGCDLSGQAVEYARQQANAAGATVRFFQLDSLREAIPPGYDVITGALFLHHLSETDTVEFLRRADAAAGSLLLVNDLIRSRTGLLLAALGTRVLSRSRIVHVDGPRSVRAAYTLGEVRRLARQAGLNGAVVERRWPCRFLLRRQSAAR